MNEILRKLLDSPPQYLQAAALCLRKSPQGEGREVLLISSLTTGRWILPKGWPMRGRTLATSALQEAWEEAGVQGHVADVPAGRYSYEKAGRGGRVRLVEVHVFPVIHVSLAEVYPEAGRRKRIWVAAAEAADMVHEMELKQILRGL